MRTFDARVAGPQVGLELEARFRRLERQIGHRDVAHSSSGAAVVGQIENVRLAADVAHVQLGTASELHAPVHGRLHLDHLVVRTARLEALALTVVLHVCSACSHNAAQSIKLFTGP